MLGQSGGNATENDGIEIETTENESTENIEAQFRTIKSEIRKFKTQKEFFDNVASLLKVITSFECGPPIQSSSG